jgi:hypothetical protein
MFSFAYETEVKLKCNGFMGSYHPGSFFSEKKIIYLPTYAHIVASENHLSCNCNLILYTFYVSGNS